MNRKYIIAAISLCIIAGIALISSHTGSEPDLLQHARVATTLKETDLFAGSYQMNAPFNDGYMWVDDHRLLRYICPITNPGYGSPFLQDINSGVATPFPIPASVNQGALVSISRDCNELLWNDSLSLQGNPIATAFNFKKTVSWKRPWNTLGMTWMPDSKRWLTVTRPQGRNDGMSECLAIYSLDGAPPSEVPLTGLGVTCGIAGFAADNKVLISDRPDGRFDVHEYVDGHRPDRPYMLHVLDLQATPAGSSTELPVHVPQMDAAQDGSMQVSPQGDHILWWFRSFNHSFNWSALRRFMPWLPSPVSSYVTVFVSDIHGDHLREIGRLDEKGRSMLSMPKWCPDGHHISFTWDDKLYRVSSD